MYNKALRRAEDEEITTEEILASWGISRDHEKAKKQIMYADMGYRLAIQRRYGGGWNQVGEIEEYGRATEVPMAKAIFTNEGDQLPVDLEPLREIETQVPRDGLIPMPRGGYNQTTERVVINALARSLVRKLLWKERVPDRDPVLGSGEIQV
eukprot:GHVU01108398.1.p1 GENE.GHVU01108398.1~~GHVU01108398.1.p1  ORF type:complete len:163 (-),score=27.55 GHVU01108398.1:16-471(-)